VNVMGFFSIFVYFSILIPKMIEKIIYQNGQILPAR